MKIFVTTKPRSKKVRVEQLDQTNFIVFVKEPPLDGRANQAVVEALAEYFQITVSQVELVSGHNGRRKILELHL